MSEHSCILSGDDAAANAGGTQPEPDFRALQCATLDAFLPLMRMKSLAQSAHLTYQQASPFPHIILDDFFNPRLLDRVVAEFPLPGQINWGGFSNKFEVKLSSSAEATFGAVTGRAAILRDSLVESAMPRSRNPMMHERHEREATHAAHRILREYCLLTVVDTKLFRPRPATARRFS